MSPPLYNNTLGNVPPEVFQLILEFANWGSLAKLACVQTEWSGLLVETATSSDKLLWNLAQSLQYGSQGLAKQPEKAVALFRQIAGISLPVSETRDDNTSAANGTTTNVSDVAYESKPSNQFATLAMQELANFYFQHTDTAAYGLQWLKAAYEQGQDTSAAYDVARVYEYGQYGLARDVVEAAVWLEKGALDGNVDCMTELALCYELGCGVPQDDEKALDWYYKAAEMGNLTAKFSVGEAFEEARGVPQSDEEACLWYYKAAIEGDEDSRKALKRLQDIARIVCPQVAVLLED